jgi:iron complex outermembrane recepter protein
MRNTQIRSTLHGLKLGVIGLACAGNATLAQDAGSESRFRLEEVIVTAQRREESLQNAPVSIQALSAEDLEIKGIFDLVDLHTHVPNFQIAPHPSTSSTIRTFMRGVGNNDDQITQDPSVAIYLDNAYIARVQGLAMEVAEISRIEVLRGPQGTLYGRNSTGGAINFVSLAPDVDEFGFKQTVGLGDRSLRRSHTRVNVPVIDGELGVQLSYLTSQQEGYIDNLGIGNERFGDRDRDAWRIDTLWQPSDSLSLRYNYDRSEIRDTPHFIDAVTIDESPEIPDEGSIYEPDLRRDDIHAEGHSLTISWALAENIELKSMTTYREMDSVTDRNYLTDIVRPRVPLTGSSKLTNQDQFSQEFQLTGSAFGDSLEYVLGAYYFEESADDTSRSGSTRNTVRFVTADNEARAFYGQGTWTPDVLDRRLHLTVGGRWSKDEREASYQDGTVSGGLTGAPTGGDNSYDNFSPTGVLAWDVSDSISVYAKASRGYKSGGFNLRASSRERFSEGFDEEQLLSYEIGLKSQLLDDRVRLNAAAFYSDYDDIQINTQSDPADPSITDVLNAGRAVIKGVEVDLTALITENLSLNLNYGHLSPEFRELLGADGVDRADDVTMINAPDHKYSIDLAWTLPRTPIGAPSLNLGYTWQDDMNTSTSNPTFIVESYGLFNARMTLADIPGIPAGSLRASVWGKNLSDEEYYISLFSVVVPAALYGEPRSYGIDLTYEF